MTAVAPKGVGTMHDAVGDVVLVLSGFVSLKRPVTTGRSVTPSLIAFSTRLMTNTAMQLISKFAIN